MKPKRRRKPRHKWCIICQQPFRLPRNADNPGQLSCHTDCKTIHDAMKRLGGNEYRRTMTPEEMAEENWHYREAAMIW